MLTMLDVLKGPRGAIMRKKTLRDGLWTVAQIIDERLSNVAKQRKTITNPTFA